jgi:predicted HD phosphohydrolase
MNRRHSNFMNMKEKMEIFNTSEVFILTQSADEKASDEYVAARKMFSIAKSLNGSYDVDSEENLEEFDNKAFIRDAVLTLLIYPHQRRSARRRLRPLKSDTKLIKYLESI